MNRLLGNKFFVIFFAPFLLGSITVLSFPPYNFFLINFFSFSLLLFLISVISKKIYSKFRKKKFNRYFFYIGCAFGFGFFLSGNYWIVISLTHDEAFKFLIPFALILIPLFLSLFFGLAVLISGQLIDKKIYFILLFSLIFSIFEYLRGTLLTGFPWNLISYSWIWSIESIQILSYIGTYSLSLVAITFFCTPFLFFQKIIVKKNIIFFLSLLILFIVNYVFGYFKINNSVYKSDENIYVKIVSPSFSMSNYNRNSEISNLNRLIKFSNPKESQKTIFIWPEGIFSETSLHEIKRYQDLFRKNFSKNHLIVLGINNSLDKKYYNSLVILNYKLDIISVYNKVNLVPFGEFLPLEKSLSKFGFKKITRGYNSFSPGNKRLLINLNNKFGDKRILPLICYEIIYTGKIKKEGQQPDLAINISEDAWFGQSIGPHQHFAKSVFRSIEEGIFIARSANKGISAFINPNGKVIKSLNAEESGNIILNFPYFSNATLFSNYGNKIFYLIVFLYMFLILIFRKYKL